MINPHSYMQYILFPINPINGIPLINDITLFPNNGEALKTKAFLKKLGIFSIIVPANSNNSKEEFCQLWKSNQIKNTVNAITNNPNIPNPS